MGKTFKETSVCVAHLAGMGHAAFADFSQCDFLLHDYGQVHARVNRAVQVIGASGVEWTNGMRVAAVEGYVNGWRSRLLRGFRHAIVPTAVVDDMHGIDIIDQRQTAALADRHARLNKI